MWRCEQTGICTTFTLVIETMIKSKNSRRSVFHVITCSHPAWSLSPTLNPQGDWCHEQRWFRDHWHRCSSTTSLATCLHTSEYKHKFHIISLLNRKTWPNFITRKIRYLIKVQTHSWVRHCDGKQEYWAGLWHPALGRFTFLLDRESWPGSRRPRGGYKEAPRA